MKIGTDTIFYIIIAIVILASTVARKKKKIVPQVPSQDHTADKGTGSGMPGKPFSPADFFREAMMQAAGIEKQPVYQTEAQSLEQIIDEEEMIPDEEAVYTSEIKDKASVPFPSPGPDITHISIEEPGVRKLFQDPEDIRKAVIFSEVLKRPDY